MEILSFYTCVPQMMIIDVWFLRYWAQQTEFLSFWAMFCPFTPLTIWKIKILTKWKKSLEISFYTSVPKIMIIFYTVPEIWCVAGVIFIFHFELFFVLYPPPLPPPSYPCLTAQKIKKFLKNIKIPEDIIILHMFSKNCGHMMYGSWDMVHDGWTHRKSDY